MDNAFANKEAHYRLCVVILDTMRLKGIITEHEYDQARKSAAARFSAPYGLLEAENMLWKIES